MAAFGSVRSGSADRRRAGPGDRCAAAGREARYKRPFDLTVLALGLVVLLPVWPVLIGAIALAVRLSGPGPVLYRQARLGRGGREFQILKFRTMAPDAEERTGPVWATWNDARTTPVGRVLRRHHLDELLQALNVLRGEMSLVGPRPERPALAARIERGLPGFGERLAVLPGIAGLAQARAGSRTRRPGRVSSRASRASTTPTRRRRTPTSRSTPPASARSLPPSASSRGSNASATCDERGLGRRPAA